MNTVLAIAFLLPHDGVWGYQRAEMGTKSESWVLSGDKLRIAHR